MQNLGNMKKHVKKTLIIGLILGAIGNWIIPYNSAEFLGLHPQILMSLVFLFGGLIASKWIITEMLKSAFLLAIGGVLAVIARIVYDTLLIDTTMHNLAPFEILLTFISAFIGALLGLLSSMLLRK